jgi:hypothetical protein
MTDKGVGSCGRLVGEVIPPPPLLSGKSVLAALLLLLLVLLLALLALLALPAEAVSGMAPPITPLGGVGPVAHFWGVRGIASFALKALS